MIQGLEDEPHGQLHRGLDKPFSNQTVEFRLQSSPAQLDSASRNHRTASTRRDLPSAPGTWTWLPCRPPRSSGPHRLHISPSSHA